MHQYRVEADWHRRLHEKLNLPWPCDSTAAFDELWPDIVRFVDSQGLSLGRGTYGGWDDGDPALARAVWCLMTHLKPSKVVETGVARGVTSRVVLEALARAGAGHLWSVDLPAPDPTLRAQIGIAVPESLQDRWTYISGTSRQRLPTLLAAVGPIDLFIHDSSHTERNLRFELEHAWNAMERGAVVADDVQQSAALDLFQRDSPAANVLVGSADDAGALFGLALK